MLGVARGSTSKAGSDLYLREGFTGTFLTVLWDLLKECPDSLGIEGDLNKLELLEAFMNSSKIILTRFLIVSHRHTAHYSCKAAYH